MSKLFAIFLLRLATHVAAQSSSQVIVGDIRVTAITANLIRVEPKGPLGSWEDSSTFAIAGNRNGFDSVPIHTVNTTDGGTNLATDYYNIFLKAAAATEASCAAYSKRTDVDGAVRTTSFESGAKVTDRARRFCRGLLSIERSSFHSYGLDSNSRVLLCAFTTG